MVALCCACGDDSDGSANPEGGTTYSAGTTPLEETPWGDVHGPLVKDVPPQDGGAWESCEALGDECAGPETLCVGRGWVGSENRCTHTCTVDADCDELRGDWVCLQFSGCHTTDSLYYWEERTCESDQQCPAEMECTEFEKATTGEVYRRCAMPCDAAETCDHMSLRECSGRSLGRQAICR